MEGDLRRVEEVQVGVEEVADEGLAIAELFADAVAYRCVLRRDGKGGLEGHGGRWV